MGKKKNKEKSGTVHSKFINIFSLNCHKGETKVYFEEGDRIKTNL